jgi:hypothetical protein
MPIFFFTINAIMPLKMTDKKSMSQVKSIKMQKKTRELMNGVTFRWSTLTVSGSSSTCNFWNLGEKKPN